MTAFLTVYLPGIICWTLTFYNVFQLLVLRRVRELASQRLHKNDLLWSIGSKLFITKEPITLHEQEQFEAFQDEIKTKHPL